MQSTFSSRGVWLQHLLCVCNEQRLLPKTRQPAGGSRAPAGLAAEWPGWPSHGPQLGSSTGPDRLLHGRPVPAFGPSLTCERPARAPCVHSEPLGPSQTRPARPPSGPFVHFFLKGAFKMFSFAILFCLNRSLVIWGKCFLVTQRKPWKNVCWQCHGPSGGRRCGRRGPGRPAAGGEADEPAEPPLTWPPGPTGAGVSTRGVCVVRRIQAERGSGAEVGKLFRLKGRQPASRQRSPAKPTPRWEGHVLLTPRLVSRSHRGPMLSFQK